MSRGARLESVHEREDAAEVAKGSRRRCVRVFTSMSCLCCSFCVHMATWDGAKLRGCGASGVVTTRLQAVVCTRVHAPVLLALLVLRLDCGASGVAMTRLQAASSPAAKASRISTPMPVANAMMSSVTGSCTTFGRSRLYRMWVPSSYLHTQQAAPQQEKLRGVNERS